MAYDEYMNRNPPRQGLPRAKTWLVRTISILFGLALMSSLAGCMGYVILPGVVRNVALVPPTYSDLPYASLSAAQKLDLYLPANGNGPFPLVILIHGGSFLAGDKANSGGLAGAGPLLAQGYAVASINYRFSNEALYPAQIFDAKAAVRFLRANAEQFQLDTERFAVFGDSAGGTLAALLGTTCGVEELEGPLLGNAAQSSCVQAVIDWYGPIDFLSIDSQSAASDCPTNQNDASSPTSLLVGAAIQTVPQLVATTNAANYITVDDASFLIEHGAMDCNVPPAQSKEFAQALAKGIGTEKVTLVILQRAGHGGAPFLADANILRIIAFLNNSLR